MTQLKEGRVLAPGTLEEIKEGLANIFCKLFLNRRQPKFYNQKMTSKPANAKPDSPKLSLISPLSK